uniref:Helicase ATP-binding domain-containing protein n=1 Tax=Oryza nivara TaxID=4536 RepID=A0A0E0FP11_ORYNI
MPVYRIRGVDVDFPYDAYDCQITYMDRVLESLQQVTPQSPPIPPRGGGGGGGGGGSQQPPYGSQPSGSQHSGGSASQSSRYPVIIYASRTHSQLRQVIKELKATSYRPKMAVLGSREQMCIHEEVSKLRGRQQNNACHYLCKKRWCRHHNSVAEFMRNNSELGSEACDIEDLVNIGRTKGPCPYYISRELSKSVDILFAPYNYLIDPGNRRSLNGIPWDNAVLIFDEAHNLESICADAASFDLLPNNLSSCIAEAQECIQLCSAKRTFENSADKQFDPENYAILKALLLALEKKISEVVIDSKELGHTKPGNYIYEFLSELNITSETSKKLIDTIDGASLLLEEGNSAETGPGMKAKATVCRLETIRDILDIIFRGGGQSHAKYYRFHVNECQQNSGDALKVLGKVSRTLSWWCFNPGLAMEEFLKLDQIWVGVVPVGPSGHPLNSSYRTRETLKYKQELGITIVNFARIVPDGLLVFFPSYSMMDKCINCWKDRNHENSSDEHTIWQRICKHKQPVIEPRQSSNFPNAIEDYAAKLRDSSTTGAIFFAVCRGKVSEGLDFADRAGRAVIVTGMPFATPTDPKVRLKRDYLDKLGSASNKNSKGRNGMYNKRQELSIRLLDVSLDIAMTMEQLFICYKKYGEVVQGLTRFFRDKVSIDSSKPNETDFNDNIVLLADKHKPQETISALAVTTANENQRTALSVNPTTKRSNYIKFAQITPANRSTLSMKHGCSSTSQLLYSGDKLSTDAQVIDLAADVATSHLAGYRFKSLGPKKAKVMVGSKDVCFDDGSPKLQHNVESRALAGCLGEQSTASSKKSNITHAPGNSGAIHEKSGGQESNAGPAFLKLAREKLSTAEYRDFVEYMKALKLKTMHIKDSLDAIAKLFSSPERLPLLEG